MFLCAFPLYVTCVLKLLIFDSTISDIFSSFGFIGKVNVFVMLKAILWSILIASIQVFATAEKVGKITRVTTCFRYPHKHTFSVLRLYFSHHSTRRNNFVSRQSDCVQEASFACLPFRTPVKWENVANGPAPNVNWSSLWSGNFNQSTHHPQADCRFSPMRSKKKDGK